MAWVRDRLGQVVWSDTDQGDSAAYAQSGAPPGRSDTGALLPTGPPAPYYEHAGPATGFSFGNLDNKQDIFYNTPSNYGVGYQKLTDYLNPNNGNSNYGSWLASQAGETQNRYNDALAQQGATDANPGLKWVDYLEQQAPGFRNMFQSLSAKGRGENPALYESGVYLG